jgi:Glycosyltransferase family 87
LGSFAAFLIVWPFRDRALLLFAACWSFPLFADLSQGQDIAFLLLILAIAWRLVRRARFLAGAVLALVALKFHLFLLVPVFLIAQRRWRMLAGASLTGSVILAVCFAVAGAHWIPEYARFVLQERMNPGIQAMPNLHGLLAGLQHDLAWETAVALVVALAVMWVARRTSFSVGLSTALVGSLLTSHHAYLFDALLLLPALLTLATEVPRVSVRLLCILLLSPIPFLVIPKVALAGPAPLLLTALLAALVAWAAATPAAEQLSV